MSWDGRKEAMGLLARADMTLLDCLCQQAALPRETRVVRPPETGLVTLRGRIGGGGSPFNVGEVTVTRASVELDGHIGHAYALGRDRKKALQSAICDALCQDETRREMIEQQILKPLRKAEQEADARRAEETAATKVDFFTMVRGED
ncbi:phosphonate C-P lyase system protein PhnG [Georhizobium sp. MAB10]|uniref:phosphonate C-P lyase system protein PhnG n=1 Tax=Georhizobium sp. MAB10 TaxID=3028319 RepID=UPI0038557EBD